MDPCLTFKVAIAVATFHLNRDAFYAGFLAWRDIYHQSAVAMLLSPAQVHPQHHLRPVLRFGPARAGMDREHRISSSVGVSKGKAKLLLIQNLGQGFGLSLQLRVQ